MSRTGPASFLSRFLALIIDVTIISLICFIVRSYAGRSSGLYLIISASYFTISLVKYHGQTLGKHLLALRVVKTDQTPIDFGTALIRWIGYYISAIPFGIGFLMMPFTKKKQALHDMLAKTTVMKTGRRPKYWFAAGILMIPITIIIVVLIMISIAVSYTHKAGQNIVIGGAGNLKALPTMTVLEYQTLEKDLFESINYKRVGYGLKPFVGQEHLCAYGLRRLQQIQKLGRYDDGKGYYEDVADPYVNKAYFSGLGSVGEIHRVINPTVAINQTVNSLYRDKDSILRDPEKIFGCVRVLQKDVIVIVASSPSSH